MDIQPIYRCAVGMDIHLRSVQVCVIYEDANGDAQVQERAFGTFRDDRRTMAEWIAQFNPDVVIMESTGIYWKSPYAALEKAGVRALVVNAQHVKNVPGRKTDVNDAQWLAMLGRSGMLKGSFIPEEALRNLRQIGRYHDRLTGTLRAEKNRLVRLLADAGLRITAVVSDAHGVAATRMIDCLLAGGTPEEALQYAGRLRAPREELLASLQGDLSEEHLFLANMMRAHIEAIQADLEHLEKRLFEGLKPYQAAMNLLLTIPGIDTLSAAKLVVEIGADMDAFGSPERLSKWAGVCPGNNQTAGKNKGGKTAKGNGYVRKILCEIAWGAVRTKSQFQGRFNGLKIRIGSKRAIVAIAHKIIKIVFVLLSRNEPYKDPAIDYEELATKRNAPRWIRQLIKFGYLTLQPA